MSSATSAKAAPPKPASASTCVVVAMSPRSRHIVVMVSRDGRSFNQPSRLLPNSRAHNRKTDRKTISTRCARSGAHSRATHPAAHLLGHSWRGGEDAVRGEVGRQEEAQDGAHARRHAPPTRVGDVAALPDGEHEALPAERAHQLARRLVRMRVSQGRGGRKGATRRGLVRPNESTNRITREAPTARGAAPRVTRGDEVTE